MTANPKHEEELRARAFERARGKNLWSIVSVWRCDTLRWMGIYKRTKILDDFDNRFSFFPFLTKFELKNTILALNDIEWFRCIKCIDYECFVVKFIKLNYFFGEISVNFLRLPLFPCILHLVVDMILPYVFFIFESTKPYFSMRLINKRYLWFVVKV